MTAPSPLTIVELRASNVKRLRAVTIRPDAAGNLVVLGGRNGQGKTSVLDAITMALGGKETICPEPIRRGAEHAEVVVDLGELVVRRTFTPGGGGQLVVANKEGARFTSPQTMLDAMVGKLTFDPLAFAREAGKRKAEILRHLVGLDFTEIDRQRAALYADRTVANKQANALRARAEGLRHHPDAPKEAPSVSMLLSDMNDAETKNRQNADLRAAAERAEAVHRDKGAIVEDLRRRLHAAELDWHEVAQVASEARHQAIHATDVDTAPIRKAIEEASAVADRVDANRKRAEAISEAALAASQSERLSEEIEAIDTAKAKAIAGAAMPVPGLGFDADGGVTLDGIPLEQASGAEQLRVSVAIGLKMNPRLRVLLIRDASLLDSHSLRLVAEMAQQAGGQVWMERVEQDEMTTVLIEDGEAISASPGKPAPVAEATSNPVG